MTFIHSSWNDIVESLECGKLETISTALVDLFKIYSVERVPSRQTILANATKQEGDQQIGVGLQRINGLKHLFESSFFVGCRSKGKRNATKPCFELLIRAIRLILPWHKHLSDEKEHHQIER
ncbi:putative adipocyte plasma membrane-associated protein [Trichinella spiralis]|uniref:Uncharacterized protein n=1 Tax=Trichinella spiralis TaxID=6334 RepID=E5S1Q3_TRISP|nr:putative adipocyte plasma membrane-associated protein [Trichinella spiralis]KRY35768.1 hypothetical protein T01_14627 [Trichinella spiralis]